MSKKLTQLAKTSNFAVWLGSGCFLALQCMKMDLLIFDVLVRLWLSKGLSLIVIICCALSGYRLNHYLRIGSDVYKEVLRKRIQEEENE